jgi:hypothetical protein
MTAATGNARWRDALWLADSPDVAKIRTLANGGIIPMSKHIFAVLTNPVEGREAEFNAWYDDRHLHDILKLPVLISAQRFRLSPEQIAATPYRYLVLYEIETNDLAETIRELKANDGTDDIPTTTALASGVLASFFEPIGPLVARR